MTNCSPWDAAAQARVNDRWLVASAEWNTAMTEALLSATDLRPDSVVLDLAAGSGEPALSIARRLPVGKVLALDSSGSGLQLVAAHAGQIGLASKIACIQADAQAIPLAQNSVDRIACRCGIMFFEDTALVVAEMMRVLKSGGRVALLAWGPFEQPLFEATVGVVLKMVPGSEMPREALKMFRFARSGSLERALRAAGFTGVREERLTVPRIWRGTPEDLWVYQQEVSTLCNPLFASIPSEVRSHVDAEVSLALSRFQQGKVLRVPVNVIVAAGTRG